MLRLWRIPHDTVVGALLRAPLRLIPGSSVLRVRSGVNRGMRWIVGSSIHGCWLGHYETEKQAAIRRLVGPGMKIFDIGANAGFYTLAFSRLTGPTGRVWAFEPLPENIRNLRRHVELNGLQNVTLVDAAVAQRSGVAGFEAAADNSMGHLSERSELRVRTVSIDEFCADPAVAAPDLIKLDVEGAESAVLEGARRTLARSRPVVLLATHGADQARLCVDLLRQTGYRLSALDGAPVAGDPAADELIAIPPSGA
jgi:FkbM family methyltransferase